MPANAHNLIQLSSSQLADQRNVVESSLAVCTLVTVPVVGHAVKIVVVVADSIKNYKFDSRTVFYFQIADNNFKDIK